MTSRRSWFVLMILLFATVAMGQTQYYIDSNAPGNGLGTINSPFDSLFDLPDNSAGEDTVIRVARGSVFNIDRRWQIYSNTRVEAYGSGADPIIDGGDQEFYGMLYMEDVRNVWVEGIDLRRGYHGVLVMGSTYNVIFWEVDVSEMYFFGGFAHEDVSEAEGRVEYYYCTVSQVEGDGFSNRGGAFDKMVGCEVTHCGPLWGTYELSHRIPENTRGINYIPVTTPAPKIKRTIFVDSINGDDDNDGLSPLTAWQTVTKVNSSSLAGDRINLMNGSSFGDTFVAKSDQWWRSWGNSGSRAQILHFGDSGIDVNDVQRVWIEGIHARDCGPFVDVTGDVNGILIFDCYSQRARTAGYIVRASDATGSGEITVFNCRSVWNEDGDVFADSGDYKIRVYGLLSDEAGRSNASATSASIHIAGECNADIYDVNLYNSETNGIYIETNDEPNLILGAFVHDVEDGSATTTRRCVSITGTGAGTTQIGNSVFNMPNPGSGEETNGVYIESGARVQVFNNTFQDQRTTGGSSSSSIFVNASFSGTLDVRNNIFERLHNANNSSYYVSLDADDVGSGLFFFNYNWYSDWTAAGTLNGWRDNGSTPVDLSAVSWVGLSEVFDGVVTGQGGLILDSICTNADATLWAHDARIDDAASSAVTAHWTGQNLLAEGLVSWDYDGGHRPRSRAPVGSNGGWMPGAFINQTGSPDGATTHPDSGIHIRDTYFGWCQNGIDPTHDQVTTEDEMAVIGCTFENCYDGAFETLFTRAFPIRDNIFLDSTMPHLDAFAPSTAAGDVWEISGNYFGKADAVNSVQLRSNTAAVTYNLSNNIFVGLEGDWWARPTQDFGTILTVSSAANTIEMHGNVFWLPHMSGSLSGQEVYCVQANNSAPTINASNNLFFAADEANTLYVKYANVSNIGSWDQNFYWLATTNLSNWDTGSNVNFAAWQTATSDDAGSWHQATRITARPLVGTPGDLTPEDFRVNSYSPQGKGGSVEVSARRAWGSSVRPESGTWSVGPFARPRADGALYWTRDSMVLSGLATEATLSKDFQIRPGAVGKTECVKVAGGSLANSAGTDTVAVIHEGNYDEGKVLWSGLLPSTKAAVVIPEIQGSPGRQLFLSFTTAVDDIVGNVRFGKGSGPDQASTRRLR